MALDGTLDRDLGERGRTITIRRATTLDIASIMAVVEAVIAETYSHLFEGGRVPKPDPSDPWATARVAEAGQAIVGVGLATGDAVDDLWISKSYRGLGLGAHLLTSLETQIAGNFHPQARLRVVASNLAARRFYRHHGWIEGRRYGHERWSFDMVDLSKHLTVDGGA